MLGLQCQPGAGSRPRPAPAPASLMRPPSSGPASPAPASVGSSSASSGHVSPAGSPSDDAAPASTGAGRRERVSSSSSSDSSTVQSPGSPNLLQTRRSPPAPSLAGHLKLINAHQLASGAAKRPASPEHGRSPGYHSAGSSPSPSGAASPVSSSSSSAGCSSGFGSFCSAPVAQQQQHQSLQQQQQQHRTGAQTQVHAHLKHQSPGPVSSGTGQHRNAGQGALQPHLLDYFPQARHDGLNLTWFHAANSRQSLNAAIASSRLIVAGDISLAEMSRYPVPIMARPPLGASDLTLENWLQAMATSQKGVKLTFTSTRTVEPAFRVLARHADQLRGPLILNADVLVRPGSTPTGRVGRQVPANSPQQQQPVDAWTFLMLCRTRFPKCIISIGWCPSPQFSSELQQPLATTQRPNGAPSPSSSGGQMLPATGAGPAPERVLSPTSGAEPMFELDLVMEHPELISGALSQHIQQLAAVGRHLGQTPHPAVQRLGVSGACAADSCARPGGGANMRRSAQAPTGALAAHMNRGLGLGRLHAHQLLASSSSLNSSSGNSSGSPSPTSPVGCRLSSGGGADVKQPEVRPTPWHSNGQLARQLVLEQQAQLEQMQAQLQLPLNLNINEADPRHASRMALGELAQQIQASLQHQHQQHQQQHQHQHQHQHEHITQHQTIGQDLAGLLPPTTKHLIAANTGAEPSSWPHVNKKAALAAGCRDEPAPNLLCVGRTTAQQGAGYTRDMIDKMASLVKEYNLTQAVTFPVEARLLTAGDSSLDELQRLLYQVGPNSTLTLVAQPEDLIKVDELLAIRNQFAADQLLFDLPDELAASLRQRELGLD